MPQSPVTSRTSPGTHTHTSAAPAGSGFFWAHAFFVLLAQCSLLFLFREFYITSLIKISAYTMPLIGLNLFAVACYVLQRPRRSARARLLAVVWAVVCVGLALSTQLKDYQGVFGPFIWVLKDLPATVLLAIGLGITLYLLFLPFKIMTTVGPERAAPQGGRAFAKGYVLPCLAGLAVAVFTGSNNHTFLTPLTFAILAGLLMLLGAALYTLNAWATQRGLSFSTASLLTALGMLIWGYFPAFVGLLRLYMPSPWLFVAAMIVLPLPLFLLLRAKPAWLAVWLGLSMPLAVYSGFTSDDSLTAYNKSAREDTFALPPLPARAIPTDAPNVYIFVYDGTPTLERLRMHGADADGLRAVLDENHFKVYDDTYSIGQVSLLSMSSMYNMSELIPDTQKVWQANAGLAAGFQVFRENGYRTVSIQQSFMTGTFEFFDVNLPPRDFYATEKGEFLGFILQSLFSGEFRFEFVLGAGGNLAPYKDEVLTRYEPRRMVVVHNYFPGHTQISGACRPDEADIYRANFQTALGMLRQDMERIRAYDPTAVVVVMGDHGSYLSGDCTPLAGTPLDTLTEDIVRDRYNTLVAIRWPDPVKAAQYDKELIVNQDILPVVFAYLYDSPEPLQWKVDPVARLRGLPVIDHGRYCLPESLEKHRKQ